MRFVAAFILTITLTTGVARASSFVVMGEAAPTSTPSIITLGQPAPVKIAKLPAPPSSKVDKSLGQSQHAYLHLKQADRKPFASVKTGQSGEMETPSIIAMGEPAPAIAYEKVAAIPKKPRHGPLFQPLVIRGGVAGDAFTPASTPKKPAVATNAQETTRPAASSGGQPPSPPPPPVPAAPPPALAPKGMPQ